MKRVIIVNRFHSPSREEIDTVERGIGERLFSNFPNLKWAGYSLVNGSMKKSASWIVPDDYFDLFVQLARTTEIFSHEIQVYNDGVTQFGGQTEVRIV